MYVCIYIYIIEGASDASAIQLSIRPAICVSMVGSCQVFDLCHGNMMAHLALNCQ